MSMTNEELQRTGVLKTILDKDNNFDDDEMTIGERIEELEERIEYLDIEDERKDKIIDNASCISYKRKYYIPINLETGEVTNFQKGTKCTLIIDYDGEYIGEIENHYYKMLELENRDSVMKKESEITDSIIEKEHHKYIPPKNHPWRKNMMLK